MANLSREICFKFKEARIAKGMNQSSLAREVGCKQSAISMFEAGQTTKLSDETVAKLSEFLGVPLVSESPAPADPAPSAPAPVPSATVHGYCPNCNCPSNVPYAVDGKVVFRPSRKLASPTGGKFCTQCGEILETRCPACGAPLNDGACCATCGTAYVTSTLPEGVDANAYSRIRREEITQIRAIWD